MVNGTETRFCAPTPCPCYAGLAREPSTRMTTPDLIVQALWTTSWRGQDGLASLQPGFQPNRKFLGPPGETSPGEPSTTYYTASSSGSAPATVAGHYPGIPPTIRHVSETSVCRLHGVRRRIHPLLTDFMN